MNGLGAAPHRQPAPWAAAGAGSRPWVWQLATHSVAGHALCDYDAALAAMAELVARPPDARDVLMVLEHPPTITLGRSGWTGEAIDPRWQPQGEVPTAVAVREVARGGSATWHAPGQLVIYPIIQLNQQVGACGRGPLGDLPAFMRLLERCVIATCQHFGVDAQAQPGRSGVWLDERHKLASLGLGVRRGWTFHGLALNVAPQLDGFRFAPCGLTGVQMTSLAAAATARGLPVPSLAAVRSELVARLVGVLERRTRPPAPAKP